MIETRITKFKNRESMLNLLLTLIWIVITYNLLYRLLLWLSLRQLQSDNVDNALQLVNLVIRLFFRPTKAYFMRGLVYEALGDHKKSIESYNKALNNNSHDPITYTNRGVAYEHLGQYDVALADYNHALELNPNIAMTYNNRSYLLAKIGDYDASIVDANTSIKLDPNLKNGFGTRGHTYFLMGDYDSALADFKRAEQLKKHDVYALVGQAASHYAMKNNDTAQHLWKQVIARDEKYNDINEFIDEFDPAEPFVNVVREVAQLV